jgi:hypothetical protein
MTILEFGPYQIHIKGYTLSSPDLPKKVLRQLQRRFVSPLGPDGSDPNPETTLANRIVAASPFAKILSVQQNRQTVPTGAVI